MENIKEEIEILRIEILEDLKHLEGFCDVEYQEDVEIEIIEKVVEYLNNSNRVKSFNHHKLGESEFFKIYIVGIEKSISNRVEIYINFKQNNDEKLEISIY